MIHFERLAAIEGVLLISLQKGFGEEQLAGLAGRFPVLELGDDLDADSSTIQDTQAVMMNLDLVIVPDTMLAHLAGTLGVRVWIALSQAPDWRWLVDREDSPWYPTARLFRQSERGRWEHVFDRMAAGLSEMVASRQQVSDRSTGALLNQNTGGASRPVAVQSPHLEEHVLHIPPQKERTSQTGAASNRSRMVLLRSRAGPGSRVVSDRAIAWATKPSRSVATNSASPASRSNDALVRPAQRSPANVSTGTPCQSASIVVVPPLYGNVSSAISMSAYRSRKVKWSAGPSRSTRSAEIENRANSP